VCVVVSGPVGKRGRLAIIIMFLFIKFLSHEVQAGALRDGDVHLSVCLSVHLSVCLLKRVQKTRFSQKLSNLELWSVLTTHMKS